MSALDDAAIEQLTLDHSLSGDVAAEIWGNGHIDQAAYLGRHPEVYTMALALGVIDAPEEILGGAVKLGWSLL